MSVSYHTNVPFSAIDDRAKRLKEDRSEEHTSELQSH